RDSPVSCCRDDPDVLLLFEPHGVRWIDRRVDRRDRAADPANPELRRPSDVLSQPVRYERSHFRAWMLRSTRSSADRLLKPCALALRTNSASTPWIRNSTSLSTFTPP